MKDKLLEEAIKSFESVTSSNKTQGAKEAVIKSIVTKAWGSGKRVGIEETCEKILRLPFGEPSIWDAPEPVIAVQDKINEIMKDK